MEAHHAATGRGPAILTIGQLAGYVGVTVRAVRHYHQRGLLPEPQRDASGYRRYGADAVIDLIRIKALADAGVPLARIAEVLAAGPADFAQAIAGIDQALARRIRDLQDQRRRIAQLTAGDRLFVPAEIADLFEVIRELGVSADAMRIERDGWILLAARYPAQARSWARDKLSALADPEFRRLYRRYYETFDWDPADPRLADVAREVVDFAERHRGELEPHQAETARTPAGDPVAMSLLLAAASAMPAAWERLDELCGAQARSRGLGESPVGLP